MLAVELPPLDPDKLSKVSHDISSTKQPSFSNAHNMYSTNNSLYRQSCSETSSIQQGAPMPPVQTVVALLEASSMHSLTSTLDDIVTSKQLEQVSSSRQANSSVGQDSVLSVLSSFVVELAISALQAMRVVVVAMTRRTSAHDDVKVRRKPIIISPTMSRTGFLKAPRLNTCNDYECFAPGTMRQKPPVFEKAGVQRV